MSERSLVGYLLVPRPGDLIKAWIFPLAFAFGVLAAGAASGREVTRAALVWFALELLIYQARYQWNDIRGFDADQRHPDRAARGRLPGPVSRRREHIAASTLVAVGRLGLVAVIVLVASSLDLAWPFLLLALAVFAIAALYELLRSRATGAGDGVPAPPSPAIVALWAVVGGGYAVRGFAGLALGCDVSGRSGLALLALAAFWCYGIAFVTGRWALEALAFARVDGQGRIMWQVEARQAREHTLSLARWLPAPGSEAADRTDGSLVDWRPLRGGVSMLAPWNLAAVLAGAAAAATGCVVSMDVGPLPVAMAAVVGGSLAAFLIAARQRHALKVGCAAAAFVLLAAALSSPRPLPLVLPWLAVVAAHLFFTAQSLHTLPHPIRSAVGAVKGRVDALPGELPSVASVQDQP
jgi:4-hydroxybenzoate polyprenyltransferase